jgi:hypothetical protein
VQTVAARFKPGAAARFFQLCELNDGRAELQQLWGRELAARLGDALWSEPLSNAQRISILQDYLLLRRARAAAAPGRHRQHAIAAIEGAHGMLRVEGWRSWACRASTWPCNSGGKSASAQAVCAHLPLPRRQPGQSLRSSRTGRKWPCNTAISTSRT